MTDKSLGLAVMLVLADGTPVSAAVPLPVAIDGDVTINGPVSIPGSVEVSNDAGNPLPVAFPAPPTVNIGSMPEIEIKNDSGNPIPVSGSAPVGSAPTQPPLSVSGVDAAGLKRHLLTDPSGQQRVIGPAQATIAATIASGTALSGLIDLGDLRAVRIAMPAAWTAAVLTFQVSYDGATMADLYDEGGNEVSYTPVAGKSMRLPVGDWLGVRFLKIRSGASAAPVNQAADRAFTIIAQ